MCPSPGEIIDDALDIIEDAVDIIIDVVETVVDAAVDIFESALSIVGMPFGWVHLQLNKHKHKQYKAF